MLLLNAQLKEVGISIRFSLFEVCSGFLQALLSLLAKLLDVLSQFALTVFQFADAFFGGEADVLKLEDFGLDIYTVGAPT